MRLVSNYPGYTELKELVEKYPKAKRLNIFLDLKNSLRKMYDELTVKNLLESYSSKNVPNLMIFSSWLDFISYMYKFSYNQNIEIDTFTIADNGEYQYHKAISKDYKSNRLVSKSKTSPYLASDEFHKMLMENYEAIMGAAKYMYRTYGIYLKYCESDFVSYYLISKYFNRDDCINLICSTDRDMFQTMVFKNVEQYVMYTVGNRTEFYNKDNWGKAYKVEDVPVDMYIYMKSVMGDPSDGIKGVHGVGPTRSAKIMKLFNEIPENIDDFEQKISELSLNEGTLYKYVKNINEDREIVRKNYRLISFDELIKNLSVKVVDTLENIPKEEKMSIKDTFEFINMTQRKVVEDISQ